MNWEKFKDYFHESYHVKMKPFIESKECDKIYEFLKTEAGRGKKIAPLSSLVFRCFKETPLNEVKVILMGMCPYHTTKSGVMVADGLLMGCSVTNELQPSLEQFYSGIENELYKGLNTGYIKNPDVSYLAKQGVLMFNAALTTEINKAGSHIAIWEPFTKYVLQEVFGYTGIPVIFLGKDASRYAKDVTIFTHTRVLSHPASASYKNTQWDTEGAFGEINRIIKENNNYTINWLDELPF